MLYYSRKEVNRDWSHTWLCTEICRYWICLLCFTSCCVQKSKRNSHSYWISWIRFRLLILQRLGAESWRRDHIKFSWYRKRRKLLYHTVASFLFALYCTMKFRIHFCLIVTLFFYLIRSTEYVIILIVERICSISKPPAFP